MCYDGHQQYVGLRFQNVLVPQGATINEAYVVFKADESNSGSVTLTIAGYDTDDAPEWNSDYCVSSATKTSATESWTPVAWTAGTSYNSDTISEIIEEIVGRTGWDSGNALSLIIYDQSSGTTKRVAESRNKSNGVPARLVISYTAESCVWAGTTSTAWNTASNWEDSNTPDDNEDVVIPGSLTNYPTVTTTEKCNLLTIKSGGQLTIGSGADLTTYQDIDIFGTLKIDAGTISTNTGMEIFVMDGGTFDLNGGTVDIDDEFRTKAGCTVDISGGTLNIGDDWERDYNNGSAYGTISISGGTITVADDCKFSSSTNLTGTMSGSFTLTVGDDMKISSGRWSITGGTIILTGSKDGSALFYSYDDAVDATAYNLTVNGSGKTFYMASTYESQNEGVHILNDFKITAGTVETKNAAGQHTDKLDVDGKFTMESGAHFKDAIESTDTYSVEDFDFDANSTYEYYGTTQDIPEATFGHLTISASGTKSLADSTVVAGNLSISNGVLSVTGSGKLSVTGTTNNSVGASGFVIKSGSSGTGSVIFDGAVTGNVTVERFLTHDRWHYIAGQTNISGNFSTLNMGLGTPGSTTNQFYRWEEDYQYSGNTGVWVDILNGEDGTGTNTLMDDEGFDVCKGYAINYVTTDKTLSLYGVPYTADQSITLTKTTNSSFEGLNLVGNPFTSTLAANTSADATDNFLSENSTVLDASHVAVYLWNEQSGWTYPDNDDYVTVNNASDATFIQPGQAFMVVAKNDAVSLSFAEEIRKHGSASFYKAHENGDIARFELGVKNPDGQTNSVLIAFIPDMTPGLDPGYDAGKISANANLSLYTRLVDDNGTGFAIQSLPPVNESVSVKVGLKAGITGIYHFETVNIENFEGITVKLEDKLTGLTIDLADVPEYTFSINQPGEFVNRFVLHFNETLGVDEDLLANDKIGFYCYNKKLHITDRESGSGTFQLFNLTGQLMMEKRYSADVNTFDMNFAQGFYIVKIFNDNKTVVSGKIYNR